MSENEKNFFSICFQITIFSWNEFNQNIIYYNTNIDRALWIINYQLEFFFSISFEIQILSNQGSG